MKSENKKSSWIDFVNKDWFKDFDNSTIWVRIYSVIPVPQNKIQQYFENATDEIDYQGLNIKFLYLGIDEGFNLPSVKGSFPYSDPETGQMVLKQDLSEIKFPKSSYIILIAPYCVDGERKNEYETKSKFDSVEAVFSSYVGNNLLHTKICECEIAINDKGKSTYTSDVYAVPQVCDGPILDSKIWRESEKTIGLINQGKPEVSRRIELALKFFHKGKLSFHSDESFFFYWTAITVLTESGTKKINEKLQKIYDLSQEEVEEKLLWKWAYTSRNNLFKEGNSINFHMNIQRYFQYLFLDLLRYELNMDSMEFTKKYISQNPDFRN